MSSLKSPKTLILCTLTLFLAFLVTLWISKDSLKSYFLKSSIRPTVGEDYSQLKITYSDLFEHNSEEFNIAGKPDFPINTDSAYPVNSASVINLSEKIHLESLLNIAYSQPKKSRPTMKMNLMLQTNKWQRICKEKKEIVKITISPFGSLNDSSLELANQTPQQLTDESLTAKTIRLFNYFLLIKQNGDSPTGEDFNIPFDEFCQIYGYGQCQNQAFALADLFEKNNIPARLVQLPDPPHFIVEAKVDQKWIAFDPLLNIAFINSKNSLDFAEVQNNIDSALNEFAGENSNQAKFYYQQKKVTIVPFTSDLQKDSNKFSFSLGDHQSIEYDFNGNLPWRTTRNLRVPKNSIGLIRLDKGVSKLFEVTTPYSMNSAIVEFLYKDTAIKVDDSEIYSNPSWSYTRLVRYLWGHKSARIEATKPIKLATILQFSILPYYKYTDGFIRVNARDNMQIQVTIDYFVD